MQRLYAPADEYLESQVRTASREQLHLMVVDAALRSIQKGVDALQRSDVPATLSALSHGRACLAEMISVINPEPAPEIAHNVRRLFAFAFRQLILAEQSRSPQPAIDAQTILKIHRETWVELMQQLQSGRTPPAAVIPPPHTAKAPQTAAPKLFRSV